MINVPAKQPIIKICERCGAEITTISYNRKYCDDCQPIVVREYNRNYNNRRYRDDPDFRTRMIKSQFKFAKKRPHQVWATHTISRHRRRGFKIDVTIKQITELAKKTTECWICGAKLVFGYKGGKHGWYNGAGNPSLDVINSTNKVLVIDNIQIICAQCNSAKHGLSMTEFINYCKTVIQRYKKPQGL